MYFKIAYSAITCNLFRTNTCAAYDPAVVVVKDRRISATIHFNSRAFLVSAVIEPVLCTYTV